MDLGSLELIQPCNTTTAEPGPPPSSAINSKTATEILSRSRLFVDALNSRSFRTFLQDVGPEHIAGNFTAYLDNQALAFTWPEFVSTLHEAAQADPEYRVGIIDQSVDLDEINGHAVVFMFVEITGRPLTIKREAALVFEWKRQSGVWQCYGHTAIRGSSAVPLRDEE